MEHRFALQTPDGKHHPVDGPFKIGRSDSCELTLDDHHASRLHAQLWVQQGWLFVRDERSSNGTYLNGQMLTQPARLKHGDSLLIGDTTLTVIDLQQMHSEAQPTFVSMAPPAAGVHGTTDRQAQARSEPIAATAPARVQSTAAPARRRPNWLLWGILVVVVLGGVFTVGVAGGWLLSRFPGLLPGASQSRFVLALALNLSDEKPVLSLLSAPAGSEHLWLPAGRYYIEAIDQDGYLVILPEVSIPASQAGGDFLPLPGSFRQAGEQASPEQADELRALANFLVEFDLARLTALEILSYGSSQPLYAAPYDINLDSLDSLLEQYPGLLARQEQVLLALGNLERRAGVSASLPGSPSAHLARPRGGVVSGILSFFGFLGDAGERARQQIIQISDKLTPEQKAEAFESVGAPIRGGAENFDQLLEKLKAGELDNAAAQIRKQMLASEGFYFAGQDVTKSDRVGLSIAHQEGGQFVTKGAELYVDLVKDVLTQSLPGIDKGFEYADKANEWVQYVHDYYTDPLGSLEKDARGQIKDRLSERIKADLLERFPNVDEDKLGELANTLGEKIVAAVPQLAPSKDNQQGAAGATASVLASGGSTALPASSEALASEPPPTATRTSTLVPSPTSSPTAESTSTPEPSPTASETPDYSWIEPMLQTITQQLLSEQYDPIGIAVFVDDLRQCLHAEVADGASREQALETCGALLESLAETPTMTPTPISFAGSWHSSTACENEDFPWRWAVNLSQDGAGKVSGTIIFHRCPGGGRVAYSVSGMAGSGLVLTLNGRITLRAGDLGNSAVSPLTFTIEKGLPPQPNYAP